MDLFRLVTQSWALPAVMTLCRVISARHHRAVADWMAATVMARSPKFTDALLDNMAVVLGAHPQSPRVAGAVRELLCTTLISYAELFRWAREGPGAASSACYFSQDALDLIRGAQGDGRGLVLTGAHTCGFDLLLLGLQRLFPSVQVLSRAAPKGNLRSMNALRARMGLQVTPISFSSLCEAARRLQAGGIVVIGADSPVDSGAELSFFGRQAWLPTGHARLALDTDARLVVGVSQRVGERAYVTRAELVSRPPSRGNKRRDARLWAQQALTALEALIRERPEQWLMPVPVWPGTRGTASRRALSEEAQPLTGRA